MTDHLELDDIQHFLLTRTPALAARYEFLSFANAERRPRMAGRHDRQGRHRRVRRRRIRPTRAGSPSRSRGTGCARSASTTRRSPTFPEEFREGLAARADDRRASRARTTPITGTRGSPTPSLHAIVILFARDVAERERAARAREHTCREIGGVALLSSLDLEAISAVRRAARALRLSRSAVARSRSKERTSSRRPARVPPVKAGEFFLGYPDESGADAGAAAARGADAQRQLPRVPAAAGARRRLSRLPRARRATTPRGAGAHRREADGPLAQRRAARARARARTTRRSARTCSARTTSTTPRWIRTATRVPVGSHIRRMNPRDTGDSLAAAPA